MRNAVVTDIPTSYPQGTSLERYRYASCSGMCFVFDKVAYEKVEGTL
jgi:hypothetical protein